MKLTGAFLAKVRAASLDEACDMLSEASALFHEYARDKESACWIGNAFCMSWATDHDG